MENSNLTRRFLLFILSEIFKQPLRVKNKTNEIQELTLYPSYGGSISRLIIDNGKDYVASNASIMSSFSDCCPSQTIPVTKNGVPAQLIFDNIQTKSKTIESLEICTHWGVEFFNDVPLVYGPPPAR